MLNRGGQRRLTGEHGSGVPCLARKGMTTDAFAAATAETWRKGLADWNEDGERIQRFRDAAEVAIYTPGSLSGRPLSVLRSFAAPAAELRTDPAAFRERIASTVAGLLSLLGIDADPLKSREHILLSTLLEQAWSDGRDLDLRSLIQSMKGAWRSSMACMSAL